MRSIDCVSTIANPETERHARRDFDNGRVHVTRFSPAFGGHAANVLVTSMDAFNEWTGRIWGSDEAAALAFADEVLRDRRRLPGRGRRIPR